MPTEHDSGKQLRTRAILCVLGSSASFAIAAALVKAVSPSIPVIEVMLFRSLFALLAMLPFIRGAGGLNALRTRYPMGHILRTIAGFAGMMGSFYGYAHLPLAMVTALGFAMPIFLSILSVPLLGERVSVGRAASVAAGLVGVLIVLRPWRTEGTIEFVPALAVVGGVIAWAAAMVSIRRMGQAGERNITIILWFAIATTLVSALATIPVWVTPAPIVWLGLIGVGLISGAAQVLMTEGYRSGEATMLAPFEYGAIIYTVLFGWLIWDEVPGVWEATGIAFLIAAGLLTWWRENVNRSQPASLPPAPAVPRRLASAAPLPVTPSPIAKAWLNAARLPSAMGSTSSPRCSKAASIVARCRPADGTRLSTMQTGRFSSCAIFSVPSAAHRSGALGCIGTTTRSAPRIARRASLSITGGVSISTNSCSRRSRSSSPANRQPDTSDSVTCVGAGVWPLRSRCQWTRLCCGSMSSRATVLPVANHAARLATNMVLPEPPFCCATVMTTAIARLRL